MCVPLGVERVGQLVEPRPQTLAFALAAFIFGRLIAAPFGSVDLCPAARRAPPPVWLPRSSFPPSASVPRNALKEKFISHSRAKSQEGGFLVMSQLLASLSRLLGFGARVDQVGSRKLSQTSCRCDDQDAVVAIDAPSATKAIKCDNTRNGG